MENRNLFIKMGSKRVAVRLPLQRDPTAPAVVLLEGFYKFELVSVEFGSRDH